MHPKILNLLKTIISNCAFAFVFFTSLTLSLDQKYEACEPKTCGHGPLISYPFWISNLQESYRGIPNFQITCDYGYPLLEISNDEYYIRNIFSNNHSFQVVSATAYEYYDDNCPTPLHNMSLDRTPFNISPGYVNLTFLYNCSTQPSQPIGYPISCASNDTSYSFSTFHASSLEYYDNFSLNSCHYTTSTPLYIGNSDIFSKNISQLLESGFYLNWTAQNCSTCDSSGGRCGFQNSTFICFCRDGSHGLESCYRDGVQKHWSVKVIIIIGSLSLGIGILCASIFCYVRRRKSHVFLMSFLKGEKQNNRDIETFMRNYGSLIPTRYTYADVKKITHLFKEKLGQGGFGTVYKGKLLDGRLVAVKMLNETKGNGEEFINEVASISRTSHVNVVCLLGFCLQRHKRALIYEFMPNGSLDKFIGSENHQNTEQHLDWEKLHQIAIGVARGLEYLHRGCNTRIVHFDIKPHNILLDKDFFPKISDFGLAKLCTKEKSILSLLEARGTIGYIAPEVFSRNFGAVSHKSDVYSYGMVLLEMVGEKSKYDNVASDASEKYFPYWVYEHVELNKFGVLGVSAVEDIEIIRKMAIVGLWCIQTNPSDRPSMNKVIEMFERNTEILEVSPKPFLFSPTKSTSDSCTLLSLSNIPSSSNPL